jgi:hypothetical protein
MLNEDESPMANANRSRRLRTTARHSVAAAILLLLPLLALGGALMPGMVDIEAEQETAAEVSEPYFAPLHVKRRPLLIPRDFSTGFVADLASFDRYFANASPGDLLRQQIAAVNLGVSDGDLIILDDIEEFVRNVLFKDAIEAPELDGDPGLFDHSLFSLIPTPMGMDTPYQFDDFGGSATMPVAVPEPGTALLLALGLCGLVRLVRRNPSI